MLIYADAFFRADCSRLFAQLFTFLPRECRCIFDFSIHFKKYLSAVDDMRRLLSLAYEFLRRHTSRHAGISRAKTRRSPISAAML